MNTQIHTRRKLIIFGHIEGNISGEVIWAELRTQLILNYKPQVPNHRLLEEFRNTQFRGNIRHFLEEAERRRQILTSKLDLEDNIGETTLYERLTKR